MATIPYRDMTMGRWDCVGVGLCALDFLSILPYYPASNEKTNVAEARIQGGGPVPTAVYALARYGWKAAFVGCVGTDSDGDIVVQGLQRGGVDVSRMVRDPNSRTAHSFIWVDGGNGNRTVALDRTNIRDLMESEVPLDWILDSRVLLCDGRETEANLAALKAARESRTITVFDASSRRDRMNDILTLIDFPIVSRDFVADVFNTTKLETGLDRLLAYGATAAVVTVGENGCVWKTANGDSGKELAFQVEVRDTTGAGDLFHAGVIHGLLSEWEISRACRFGCAAAALKCRELGGQPGVVSVSDVLNYMEIGSTQTKNNNEYQK
jgi:sulfofructose kinase